MKLLSMIFYQSNRCKCLVLCILLCQTVFSQQFEHGSIDMGMGALLSVGLQEETGFDIRVQYTSTSQKNSVTGEFNRYFRKEFENTETFNEAIITYNRRIYQWETIRFTGGVGYALNNYPLATNATDTSNLFFTTGSLNHGANLKLQGSILLIEPVSLFVEVNAKSFGRRYDTVAFGLVYVLGI